jgi:hypothetical protein
LEGATSPWANEREIGAGMNAHTPARMRRIPAANQSERLRISPADPQERPSARNHDAMRTCAAQKRE